jgi:hypothetical protein
MDWARGLLLGVLALDSTRLSRSRDIGILRSMYPCSSSHLLSVLENLSRPVQLVSSGPGGLLDPLFLLGVAFLPTSKPGILVG